MKLSDIEIVKQIKKWCSEGYNHCPNEINVSMFVREVIPYLENLEERISRIETHINTLNKEAGNDK